MTESEMKTKWCPHVRDADGSNRKGSYQKDWPKCIGSDCSQWQWETEMEKETDDRGYVTGHYKISSDENGYCGLTRKQ